MALEFAQFQHGSPSWQQYPPAFVTVFALASAQISEPNMMHALRSQSSLKSIPCNERIR